MISEKERIVSKENYEISLKVYKLFKKYQNYETDVKNAKMIVTYDTDNLFKNRKKVMAKPSVDEVTMIEYKEKSFFKKILDKIKHLFNKN